MHQTPVYSLPCVPPTTTTFFKFGRGFVFAMAITGNKNKVATSAIDIGCFGRLLIILIPINFKQMISLSALMCISLVANPQQLCLGIIPFLLCGLGRGLAPAVG